MGAPKHATIAELEAGIDEIRRSPKDQGVLTLIVRRPGTNLREVLAQAELDLVEGLVGDTWPTRGSTRTADGRAHPDMQLNIMNSRTAALVAQDDDRRQLAGDQLYIDLDLSDANLPPGTRLARLGRDRSHRSTSHRLQEIRGTVRARCRQLRQLGGG